MREGETGSNRSIEATMEQIAPVLRALPPGTQVAFIQEGAQLLLFNINRAFELFAGRAPATTVDIAERSKLLQPRDTAIPGEDKAFIDPDHAATVDLSYPVLILADHQEMDGSSGRVIDGWHRIYRAAQMGIVSLPAIVISAEEEALIRIEPGVNSG